MSGKKNMTARQRLKSNRVERRFRRSNTQDDREAELRRIQRYEVDVTLDPDTANPRLTLSEDGKQVRRGIVQKNLPDNKQRFSMCPCVLGKQSFSSGRVYYEVQVGPGKTFWVIGVARESIDRKEHISPSPRKGYWTIVLRNGNEYRAFADPEVNLPVRENLQTVGVFVDYEEGLVSFYDVETGVHLYSYTGCSFTERLYPYFWTSFYNTDPLIISPVNMSTDLGGGRGKIFKKKKNHTRLNRVVLCLRVLNLH